jgi:hypothetical protein
MVKKPRIEKQRTIEAMLEAIFILKTHGVRGAGLDAVHELKGICEKLIAIHSTPKCVPGHYWNGDKAPFSLVTDESEEVK